MPPLALVTALAAVVATGVKRVAIPALSGQASDDLIFRLATHGRFFANLAGIAGLCSLFVALFLFVRDANHAGLGRRLLVATFSGIFLPTMALAAFFPKEHTSAEMVLFGVGAANVLAVAVCMNAVRNTSLLPARAAGLLCAAAALLAFPAQVVPVMAHRQLDAWQIVTLEVMRDLGEISYLLGLLGLTLTAFPVERGRRGVFARLLSFAVLLPAVWSLFQALAISPRYFTELLRLSQGVDFFSDKLPVLYVLPLTLAFSAAFGALVGSEANRRQVGAGLLAWMAAGYAPCSPERLVTFTLAMVLVARAVAATGANDNGEPRSPELDE